MPKSTKIPSRTPKASQPCSLYYKKYQVSEDTTATYGGHFGAIENIAVTSRKQSSSSGDSKPQDPLFKPYKKNGSSKTSSASSRKRSGGSDKSSSLRVRFSSDNSSSASAAVAVPLAPTTVAENHTRSRMKIVPENEVHQTNVLENVIGENLESSNLISSSLLSPPILQTSLAVELPTPLTVSPITHVMLSKSQASSDPELGTKGKPTESPLVQTPHLLNQDGNSSDSHSKSEASVNEDSQSSSSRQKTKKHKEKVQKNSTKRINLWKIIKRPRLYQGTHTASARSASHSKLPTLAGEPTLAEKALSPDDVCHSDNMAQTPLPIEAVRIEPFRPTRPKRHFGECFITLAPVSYDIPPGEFPVRDSSRRPAVLNLLDYPLEHGELVEDNCATSIESPTQRHIPGYKISLSSIPESEAGSIPPQRSVSSKKGLRSSPPFDTAGPPPTYIPEAPTPTGSPNKLQKAISKGKLTFNPPNSLPSSNPAGTVVACDGPLVIRVGTEMVVQKCLGPHETNANSTGDAHLLCQQCPSSTPYGTRAISDRALSNALSPRRAVYTDQSTKKEDVTKHTNTKLGSDPMSKAQAAAMLYWYEETARREERTQKLAALLLCRTNLLDSEGTPSSSVAMNERPLALAPVSANPSTRSVLSLPISSMNAVSRQYVYGFPPDTGLTSFSNQSSSYSRRSDSQPQRLDEDSSRPNQNALETSQHLFHPVSQIGRQKAVIRPMNPVSGIFIPSALENSANATKLAIGTAKTSMPIKQAVRSGPSALECNATSRHIEQSALLYPSFAESIIAHRTLLATKRETSKITVGPESSDPSPRSSGNSIGLENKSAVPSMPKEMPENSDTQPMPFAGYPSMEAAFAKIRATEMENGQKTSGGKGVKGLLSKLRLPSSKK